MDSQLTRRTLLSASAALPLAGWLGRLAAQDTRAKRSVGDPQAKACILLWMSGGPSHLDTFDLKPDAPENVRGEFRPIDTSVAGIQISEHFPKFSRLMEHAALLRGMSTVESDHQLATYHVHTGYQKRAGGVAFPSLGAIVSRELGQPDFPLPNFVCIGSGPRHATRSGLLGPGHQPLDVLNPDRGTDFLAPLVGRSVFARQVGLLTRLNAAFQESHRSTAAQAHSSALERAVRLMNADERQAFDLSLESDAVRDRYGRGSFGQGCLLARRLIETGVRFVEVMSGDGVGWDTHQGNFPRTRALSLEADAGMAALLEDLEGRGLLDTTLVIWMGEFGRSPQITSGGGRNHWARAWCSVLAGGGIRGGQVVGRTNDTAAEVVDRPISVPDFLATVCKILRIDYTRENRAAEVARPIPIVDTSKPISVISELL
jgi:hypothetical protein